MGEEASNYLEFAAIVLFMVGVLSWFVAMFRSSDDIDKKVAATLSEKTSISDNAEFFADETFVMDASSVLTDICGQPENLIAAIRVNGVPLAQSDITALKLGNATRINNYIDFTREYIKKLVLDMNGDIQYIDYAIMY